MKIKRTIQKQVEKALFKGKIVVIYGARQVGKTTLVREILRKFPEKSEYFNCDEPDIRAAFTEKTSTEIKAFIGNKKIVVLDEAQRVKNIGLALKLIADNFPEIQIVATGSSSFDLSNEIAEPLTGRKIEFHLYPFSMEELSQIFSQLELSRLLEQRMIFGMYPEIVINGADASRNLKNLASSYVYKDIPQYQGIKNPEILEKLLQALALQIGNEVSYNELAGLVGVNKNTIASYIRILESAFIIFRIGPWNRNLRSELKKLRKIYFFDSGVRNALINNLNPLDLRTDVGALWENFIISERVKFNNNHTLDVRSYFWRTKQKQEIDYLEEKNGKISGAELKWNKDSLRVPKAFREAYPGSAVELVNRKNFGKFLGL